MALTVIERKLQEGIDPEGKHARRHQGRSDASVHDYRGGEVDDFIANLTLNYRTHGEEVMRDFREMWKLIRLISSGELMASFNSDMCSVPLLRVLHERLKRRLADALLPGEDYMEYEAEDGTPPENAEAMSNVVRDANRRTGFKQQFGDETLDDVVALGMGIEETYWEEKSQSITTWDRSAEEIIDSLGEIAGHFGRLNKETRNHLKYSRPNSRTIDPMRLLPARAWEVRKLSELPWFIIEKAYSWNDLYDERIRVERIDLEGGQRLTMPMGRFKNLPPRQWASRVPAMGGRKDYDYNLPSHMTSSNQDHECMDGYEALELWINMDLEGLLFHENEMGKRQWGPKEINGWLKQWGYEHDDLQPGTGWWRITVLPEFTQVIEVSRNPFPGDEIPFASTSLLGRSRCLAGIGMYEMMWPMAATMNQVSENMRDAILKISDPMYAMNKGMLTNVAGGTDEEVIDYEPGKIIPVEVPLGGGTTLFQAVAPDPQAVQVSINAIEFFWPLMQNLLGVQVGGDNVRIDRGTATQANIIQARADEILLSMVIRFENDLLIPKWEAYWQLAQRILTMPVKIQRWDPTTSENIPETVDPASLRGEFRARSLTNTLIGDKSAQIQTILNIITQLEAFTRDENGVLMVKPREILEEAVRGMSVNFNVKRIVKTPEEGAAETQQAAQAALQDQINQSILGGAQQGAGAGTGAGPAPILPGDAALAQADNGGAVVPV